MYNNQKGPEGKVYFFVLALKKYGRSSVGHRERPVSLTTHSMGSHIHAARYRKVNVTQQNTTFAGVYNQQ